MKRAVVLLALGACGRIGFDAAGSDGGGDGPYVEPVGILDPTFGQGGQVVLIRGNDDAQIFDVRARGTGYATYGRVADGESHGQAIAWTSDGQLDPTFAMQGVGEYTIERNDWGYGMVQLADTRWMLVGDGYRGSSGRDDLMVAMIGNDGVLDPSFGGGDGLAYIDLSESDTAYRIVETARGVVVCGVSQRNLPDPHHALVGLRLDGQLDTGFGTNGVVLDDSSGGTDICYDAVVDASGRIVTMGATGIAHVVTRYTATGARDTSFGTGGRFIGPSTSGEGRAVAIAPDGDLVTVGGELAGGYFMRLAPNGTLRQTFGTAGVVSLQLGLRSGFFDVLVQPNGKIVAVGFAEVTTQNVDGFVVRLLADGTLDPSFGSGGMIVLDVGPDDTLNAVYAESEGLIAAGSTTMGGQDRPWIVRLR